MSLAQRAGQPDPGPENPRRPDAASLELKRGCTWTSGALPSAWGPNQPILDQRLAH